MIIAINTSSFRDKRFANTKLCHERPRHILLALKECRKALYRNDDDCVRARTYYAHVTFILLASLSSSVHRNRLVVTFQQRPRSHSYAQTHIHRLKSTNECAQSDQITHTSSKIVFIFFPLLPWSRLIRTQSVYCSLRSHSVASFIPAMLPNGDDVEHHCWLK